MKQIFISFSEKDRQKISLLEKRIMQSEYVDSLIVADRYDTANNISGKVIDGIESCEYFVPILTSNSIATQWVNQEIGFAVRMKKKITIIPIVDEDILDQLRGFIHKDYNPIFIYNGNEKSTFKKCIDKLLHFLEINNGKSNDASTLLPGLWRNDYVLNDVKDVEIFNVNQNTIYVNGIPIFKISPIKFNETGTTFSFTSKRIGSNIESQTTMSIKNKFKLVGKSKNGATIQYCKLTTPPIDPFYLKRINKRKLPKHKKLEITIEYRQANIEIKIGIIVGEIIFQSKNKEIPFYKFVELSNYELFNKSGDTTLLFLLPSYIISHFKTID